MRFRLTLTRTSYPYGASFGIQMVRMNLPSCCTRRARCARSRPARWTARR